MAKKKKKKKPGGTPMAAVREWKDPGPDMALVPDAPARTQKDEIKQSGSLMDRLCIRYAHKKTRMANVTKNAHEAAMRVARETSVTASRLYSEYESALAAEPGQMSIRDLKHLPVIDWSTTDSEKFRRDTDFKSYAEAVKGPRLWFYPMIPCFQKGVMVNNYANGIKAYSIFEILALDEKDFTVTVRVDEYAAIPNTDKLQPNQSYTFTAAALKREELAYGDETCEFGLKVDPDTFTSGYLSYLRIPPDRLPWNEEEKRVWQEVVIPYVATSAEIMKQSILDPHKQSSAVLFVSNTIATNYCLYKHKPVVVKPSDGAEEKEPSGKARPADKPSGRSDGPKQRIVGTVRIVSDKPPRAPGPATVKNYKLSEWTRRGHVRHCKSGKTVYVRPTTAKRRKQTGQDPTVTAPARLVIRDNAPNEDMKGDDSKP